jgi:magnesium-transporting ATPase (P-type)
MLFSPLSTRQIWMLTGDKSETAVNIGFATQMLTNDMDLLLLTVEALGSPGTCHLGVVVFSIARSAVLSVSVIRPVPPPSP